jgi:hypothetical protein
MAPVVPVWWAVLGPAGDRPVPAPIEHGVSDVAGAVGRVETGLAAHPEAVRGTLFHGIIEFQCTRSAGGYSWVQVPGFGFRLGDVRAWRP